MHKPKVLIIGYDGLGKSGVPTLISQIVNGLHDSYDFSIVVFKNVYNDYFYQDLKENTSKFYEVNLPQKGGKIRKLFQECFGTHKYLFKYFSDLFTKDHFDVIHSFKEGDSSGIFKAAKKCGISNRIFHTTVIHKYSGIFKIINSIKLRRSIKWASRLVGVSNDSCKCAFKNKHYTVLPNSFDDGYYQFVANESDKLELIQTGYFSDNKNQLFTLAVFKKILAKKPDSTLHFVGYPNDTNYYEKVLDFVKNNNLQDNVIFHNETYNQNDLMKQCSYALLPSKKEGFGIVLLEAQACGLKCVASTNVPEDGNVGGVKYLDCDPIKWVDYIVSDYQTNKGEHIKFDVKDYGRKKYLEKIKSLYIFN